LKSLIRIGARRSRLAQIQAYNVGRSIKNKFADCQIEYNFRQSLGDKNLDSPLWKSPSKGVFTEDFYQDLIQNKCDLVVHSFKDLPTAPRTDTTIAASLKREDPRDLIFFRKNIQDQPVKKLNILSSSPRRHYLFESFLKKSLPFDCEGVNFKDIRGNMETRFKKFLEGDADGLIMAKAAIDRLIDPQNKDILSENRMLLLDCIKQCVFQVAPLSQVPCAAAQGALAIECRQNDHELLSMLKEINHESTLQNIREERTLLKEHGGGCHLKIGIFIEHHEQFYIHSAKGISPKDSKSFSHFELINKKEIPSFRKQECWPLQKTTDIFERVAVEAEIPKDANLLISKARALPESYTSNKNQLLYASGWSSWQKLARRGHWICGCLDSLGEDSQYGIQSLKFIEDKPSKWLKLSHKTATSHKNYPKLSTYQLKAKEINLQELKECKYFFWTSLSLFKLIHQKMPEIITATHACGPGNTYQGLKDAGINANKIFLFSDRQAWLKSIKDVESKV